MTDGSVLRHLSRWRLPTLALSIYVTFCAISLFCLLLKIGPVWPLIIAWPYPFLLSLQQWITPTGSLSFLGAYALGFGVVFGVSLAVQHWFGPARPRGVLLVLLGVTLSYAPLFLLQSAIQWVLPGGE